MPTYDIHNNRTTTFFCAKCKEEWILKNRADMICPNCKSSNDTFYKQPEMGWYIDSPVVAGIMG